MFLGRRILRPFIADKIFPAIKKDWETFGVHIGYEKNTLKDKKFKMVKNPFWQILRYWVEVIENLHIDPTKILYKGLRKVSKRLKRDLLKWLMRDLEKISIKGIVYC